MKPVPEMLMGRTGANLQVQGSNPNQPLQHRASAMAPGDALPGRTPAMAVGSTEEPARLQIEEAIICPRCTSINTKFCYYNNYSLHQPRYFCKTCRRYWTQGGSLRDVPVGGGSRKNKLSPPSLLASASGSDSSSMAGQAVSYTNPNLVHDMNLAEYRPFPSLEGSNMCNPAGGATMGARAEKALSAMELLRSIGGHMPVQVPMQVVLGEFRAQPQPQPRSPSCLVGLSLDPNGSGGVASSEGYGTSAWMQCMQDRTGKLVFPFQDLRQPARSGAGGGESGGGSCAGANGGHHHQLEKGKNE